MKNFQKNIMKNNLTEFYVHNAMIYFLYGYEKRRYDYGKSLIKIKIKL